MHKTEPSEDKIKMYVYILCSKLQDQRDSKALMLADIKGACMHCGDRFTRPLTQYSRTRKYLIPRCVYGAALCKVKVCF